MSAFLLHAAQLNTGMFARRAEFVCSGYSGAALMDVPVLVRLSERNVPGFKYADFKGKNGSDLRFTDAAGTELPAEVSCWDESGTSCVWVRVNRLEPKTVLRMYYGADPKTLPRRESPESVWRGYTAVWHFDTMVSTNLFPDATGHGLDFRPMKEFPGMQLGGVAGRYVPNTDGRIGVGFITPSFEKYPLGRTFTVSGWFRHHPWFSGRGYDRFFSAKNDFAEGSGFEIEHAGRKTAVTTRGSSDARNDVTFEIPDVTDQKWNHLAVVYSNDTASVYYNGKFLKSGWVEPVAGNGHGLALGNNTVGNESVYQGAFDEPRVFSSAACADRVRAEYESSRPDARFLSCPDGVQENR